MIEPFEGDWPQIDDTAFVHPSAVIIGRVRIGAHCSIWPNAVLRGDDAEIVIGPRTNIQDGVVVHTTENLSRVVVGARVTVGHMALLHGCIIGDDCLIGMGSVLLDNAVVESNAYIGAASLVTQRKKIPSGVLALGNPARVVRSLTQKDLDWIQYSWKRYVANAETFKRARAEDDGGYKAS